MHKDLRQLIIVWWIWALSLIWIAKCTEKQQKETRKNLIENYETEKYWKPYDILTAFNNLDMIDAQKKIWKIDSLSEDELYAFGGETWNHDSFSSPRDQSLWFMSFKLLTNTYKPETKSNNWEIINSEKYTTTIKVHYKWMEIWYIYLITTPFSKNIVDWKEFSHVPLLLTDNNNIWDDNLLDYVRVKIDWMNIYNPEAITDIMKLYSDNAIGIKKYDNQIISQRKKTQD